MMKSGMDLISIHDLSAGDVEEILALAADLKVRQKAGIPHPLLAGKTLGMIFEKSSTRTRVSFEVGMYQLGGRGLGPRLQVALSELGCAHLSGVLSRRSSLAGRTFTATREVPTFINTKPSSRFSV